ncbi:NAD(P)-dependent glycerol-3-phosphate dehydrogenase [bacterium]|nr:MAG: NAD(P)-dependent glycerol-3-phosphate dehydrogenase [bacterium]
MTTIAVIGAGAWGTALSQVLTFSGNDVRLWSYEQEAADSINQAHENRLYLPTVPLHPKLRASTDMEWALKDAKVVISVSPSQVVRRVMANAKPFISPDALIVSASKGIEVHSLMLMNEVLEDVLGAHWGDRIAALSGPSFARETALGMPTALSLAMKNPDHSEELQKILSGKLFRVYTLTDVIGVELGGSLKNVMALAAGITDGLGFGYNSRAALITRGVAEMGRLGAKMGADPLTFLGLSGLGDLVLTCTGDLSRNRMVGMRLGQGEKLKDILASMNTVAEGVKTCDSAKELAVKLEVEMPIISKVWQVLHEEKCPRAAVEELMGRPMRREFWDLEKAGEDG